MTIFPSALIRSRRIDRIVLITAAVVVSTPSYAAMVTYDALVHSAPTAVPTGTLSSFAPLPSASNPYFDFIYTVDTSVPNSSGVSNVGFYANAIVSAKIEVAGTKIMLPSFSDISAGGSGTNSILVTPPNGWGLDLGNNNTGGTGLDYSLGWQGGGPGLIPSLSITQPPPILTTTSASAFFLNIGDYAGGPNPVGTYSLAGDVLSVSASPVPLPAAAWLMLSGLGGLVTVAKKKKRVSWGI